MNEHGEHRSNCPDLTQSAARINLEQCTDTAERDEFAGGKDCANRDNGDIRVSCACREDRLDTQRNDDSLDGAETDEEDEYLDIDSLPVIPSLPSPISKRVKALKLGKQLVRFGCISFTAFVLDFSLLALLTSGFGLHYLISNAISFTISIIYSYFLNMRFVFTRKKGMRRRRAFIIFLVLSFIGLGISELLMWIFKGVFGIAYLASKVLAGLIGAVWNFWSRKHFLDAE